MTKSIKTSIRFNYIILSAAVFILIILLCGDIDGVAVASSQQNNSPSKMFASKPYNITFSSLYKEMSGSMPDGSISGGFYTSKENCVVVTKYGANGNDRQSDTEAINHAIAAVRNGGTVLFPAGTYYCSDISVPSNIMLASMTTFGFDANGATQLLRIGKNPSCILNLSSSQNVRISGLSLDSLGKTAQQDIVCIKANNSKNIVIENCRITTGYKGAAVLLENAEKIGIRSSMLCNSTYGVSANTVDGLSVADCWLTGCNPAGYYGSNNSKNVLLSANRIEWCGTGVQLEKVTFHKLIGNYFDRCSIGGIRVSGGGQISILGNINQRNGVLKGLNESCNAFLDGAQKLTYRGNVMEAIRGDGSDTNVTPEYSLILRGLKNCLISNNTAYKGFTKKYILNYQNNENSSIADNVGSIYK